MSSDLSQGSTVVTLQSLGVSRFSRSNLKKASETHSRDDRFTDHKSGFPMTCSGGPRVKSPHFQCGNYGFESRPEYMLGK